MKNLLINNIYGKPIFSAAHMLYLDSLSVLNNCIKAVVVQHDDKNVIEKLEEFYDYVYLMNDEINDINFDTMTLNVIQKNFMDCDTVMFCDSTDVILQADPFEYLSKFEEKLFFSAYGHTYNEHWVDASWLNYFNKTLKQDLENYDDLVYCGGFVAGKIDAFLNFYYFLISNSNRNGRHIVDQPIFSYYYNLSKNRNLIKIFNTRNDNFIHSVQGLGNVFHSNKVNFTPNVKDNKIYTDQNELYYIWHQWNDYGYFAEFDSNGKAILKK